MFSENDEMENARRYANEAIRQQYNTIANSIVRGLENEKRLDRTKPCPFFYIDDKGILGYVDENDTKVSWKNMSPVLNKDVDGPTLVKAICDAWTIDKLEVSCSKIAESLSKIFGVNGVGCIDASFEVKDSCGIIVRNNTKSIIIPTNYALAGYTYDLATKQVFGT